MFHDLRYAIRALRRTPLTATAAVLTLALGMGATTTIYSVVDAAMLQPLPWPESDRLMDLSLTVRDSESPGERTMVWSYPKFETMREQQRSFRDVAVYTTQDLLLGGAEGSERVTVELVSGSYFPMLQAPTLLGRQLQPADDRADAAPVVVLSHALWMRRFGGDSAAVGRELQLGRHRLTVVGVADPAFTSLSGAVHLWLPMSLAPRFAYAELLTERWNHSFDAVGRLKDGVTPEAAASEMAVLGRVIDGAHPLPEPVVTSRWGAQASTLRDARHDPTLARSVLVLFGAVCCVMLIACVNVANLLLARAAGRTREFAVRVAIGAKRGQVMRQLLGETVLLSLVGGVLGVILAAWSVDILQVLAPELAERSRTQAAQFLDLSQVSIDVRVLAFGFGVSLLTGILCGVVPAWRASRPSLTAALKDGAGASANWGMTFRRGRAGALLVTANVALSLLLLVGAGLLAQSFARARGVDAGFDPRQVHTFRVQHPDDSAFTGPNAPLVRQALLERLAALPGVEAVGTDWCAPLSQGCSSTIVLEVDGVELPAGGGQPEISVHLVNAGYPRALGARLLAGRFLTEQDNADGPKVGVINEAAARLLFPGGEAVGRRIGIGFSNWASAEVVGVVSDVNYQGVGAPPAPAFYGSYLQATRSGGLYFVRTAGDPATVVTAARQAVHNISRALAVYDERLLEERVATALGRIRFGAVLLGSFAVLGVVLSLIGIYGVLAYTVSLRTRELGIRMALGAVRREVVGLVMQRAMLLTLIGIVVGLGAAWASARLLSGLVFGISTSDPATYLLQSLLLVSACALASYLPARRAARLDPVRALRDD